MKELMKLWINEFMKQSMNQSTKNCEILNRVAQLMWKKHQI